jgi:hypothetical protein
LIVSGNRYLSDAMVRMIERVTTALVQRDRLTGDEVRACIAPDLSAGMG